jgi:hypothetical protein
MTPFTLTGLPDGKEITVTRTREPLFNPNRTIDYLTYQRFVTDTGEQYYYVPQEFIAKGLTQQTPDGKTFVVAKPSLLDKNILKKAVPVVIPPEGLGAGSGEFEGALGQVSNLYEKPTTGFLFKGDDDVIKAFSTKPVFWNVGDSVQREGGGTSAEFSGKIVGIGEKDGNYVYLQEPREGTTSAYLTSDGTHRTYTAPSRPGGLLGTLSDFIADTPFLPEIVGIIAAANPATAPFAGEIYSASKGIQTAARGGDVGDVLKSVAVAYAGSKVVPAVVKTALPADIAAIPGAVPAVSATTTSLLTGQPLETALQTGLAAGAGSVVGGQVSGATGSQAAGQVAGGTTAGLLSGKDAASSAINALIGTTASQAGQAVNRLLTQPQATQGSSIGGTMNDFSNGAVEIFDDGSRIFFDNSGNAVGSLGTDGNIYNATGYNLQLFDDGTFLAQNINTGNFSYATTDAPLFTGSAVTGTIGGGVTGAGGGGGVGGAAGAAGSAAGQATSSLLRRLLGAATGAGAGATGQQMASSLFGNLARTGINAAVQQQIIERLQEQGSKVAEQAARFGAEARVPFTPYTVTTGLGTSTFGPTGATATAAAPYSAIQQQALQQAQETLGAINPAQATQTLFGQLEGLQAPVRQRQQEELLSRLGARGLLGFGQNLPTVGGGMGTVNPYMESLLSAQASQQAQNALAAQQFGTQEAARQQALAQALTTQGAGIDRQTADLLAQAGTLGQIPTNLALTNAQRLLGGQLAGLQYQTGLEEAALGLRNTQLQQLASSTTPAIQRFVDELFK